MKIRLLSITHKTPSWIQEGYQDYAKRIPWLELVEVSAERRGVNADIRRVTEREGEKLLAQIKPGELVVALDVKGKQWSTEDLAQRLAEWQQGGRDVVLLIGGPDGLAASCLQKAEVKWSLSTLTFPHLIVRLILAEQLYRAYSILQQHPYHRK